MSSAGTCVHCGSINCSNGHDGTTCVHCGSLHSYDACPKGHDGTTCVHCGSLHSYGVCPKGHSVKPCEYCGSVMYYGHCKKTHTREVIADYNWKRRRDYMMFLSMSEYLPTKNFHESTQPQNKADMLFDVYNLSRYILGYV